MAGDVRVGFASRDITPPVGCGIAGFIARDQTSTGIMDPLEIGALALRDTQESVVLLSADLLAADRAFVAELRTAILSQVDLRPEAIGFSVTHTHAAPSLMPLRHMGGVTEDYRAEVIRAACEAVREALSTARPSTARLTRGKAEGISINRRDPSRQPDSEWMLLEFVPRDGSAPILAVSWQCHPVALGSENRLISAEYPGLVRRQLAAWRGAAGVMFLNGCFGDINPPRRGAECMREVADGLLTSLAGPGLPRDVSLRGVGAASREIVLPLDTSHDLAFAREQLAHWEASAEAQQDPDLRRGDLAMVDWARELEATLAAGETPEDPLAELQVLRAGDLAFCLLPCEPLSDMGRWLRDGASPSCTVPVGASNGMVGYIGMMGDYAEAGYELEVASRYYALLPLLPGAGELLLETADELLSEES